MKRICLIVILTCLCMPLVFSQQLIIGTYTNNSTSKGIHLAQFNKDGSLSLLDEAAASNPSYVTVAAPQRTIFAVGENDPGSITSIGYDKAGKLTANETIQLKSAHPCYIDLDKTARWLAIANYSSGNIIIHGIDAAGNFTKVSAQIQHKGKSIDPKRQDQPHAHFARFSADNKYLFVVDLGTDAIYRYPFHAGNGVLDTSGVVITKITAGGGPRHLAFSAKDNFIYALEEISGAISVFKNTATGMELLQRTRQLPEKENASGADIHIAPDNKFLYATQRSNNTIEVYKIQKDATLLPVQTISTDGKHPRNFTIHPSGKYVLVANRDSNNIVVFKRDGRNGKLSKTAHSLTVGKPVCLQWIP